MCEATLTWAIGGPIPYTFKASTAGPFGCDPCLTCDRRPAAGAQVWFNSYGDLHCDPCAQDNAARYQQQQDTR
jgi:hypothetical protein